MCTSRNPIAILIYESSSQKQHAHSSLHLHPRLCLLDFLVAACCIFNASLLSQSVLWMFDSTSHGLKRIWPSTAHQAAKALKYSRPGAAEWTPVNNAPAVTPSMTPNHINEACRRGIQRESRDLRVLLCLDLCILCCLCPIIDVYSRNSSEVCSFHKGQSFGLHL